MKEDSIPGKNKKFLLLLIMLAVSVNIFSQSFFQLNGIVVNAKNGKPVEMAAIGIMELDRWITSDATGAFSFKKIPGGEYTIQARCLGFETCKKTIIIREDRPDFKLTMEEMSLGLSEVVVVAEENTDLGSSSKIENTALKHIQPTSLADVMQLVPGQITLNPDMSKSNQITIRDINTSNNPDDNSAMGTAIVIDGTPINNDANLQALNTASGGTAQAYSTAGQGIDLRQISTDKIESVEVIRGIPSAEYGELTTGVVLVKTKAGKAPLHAKLKADPKIKQAALSKGFLLPGQNNGALNIDFDYTYSLDDLRKPTKSYNRLTGQAGYSNTFFRQSTPLSLNANISLYSTFDKEKNDPDMTAKEKEEAKEKRFAFKAYGKWMLNKPWLTNISYNFSGSFEKQDYYQYKIVSNGSSIAIPTTTESGESEGTLLPSEYGSELTIEGKPYNYFGSIKGCITGKYSTIKNKFIWGTEWRSSGNNGKGRIYDPERPPKGALTTRARSYKDIPASHKLALFAEDKISFPISNTTMKVQAGLRYNNTQPAGLFISDGFTTLEPRLNITYSLLKKRQNKSLKKLDLRFGYGKTSKTPSIIFLSPDKAYIDEISFNYYPSLFIVSTKVIDDTSNPDLKPMTNKKFEAGLDFSIGQTKAIITAFREKIRNGFAWKSNYFVFNHKKWEQLEGEDKEPYYNEGNIFYSDNGTTKHLEYSYEQKFESYKMPVNNYEIDKKGIEYVIDLGKITPIKSSINISGAYYHITKINNVIPFPEKQNISYQGGNFPYLPIYPGNKGSTKDRLNSRIDVITHIPKLNMVTSLSAQIIWLEKTKYTWKKDGHTTAYTLNDNNEKIYGNYENADKIYVDPAGFYDTNMDYHEWQDNYTFKSPYAFMKKGMDNDYFTTDKKPVYWQINLKLTKEIGDRLNFSFFANNLLNHRPLYKITRLQEYSRLNQSAYFGAEITLIL